MTMTVSQNVREKAERLVTEGRVQQVTGEEFDVRGDHGTYLVWLPQLDLRLPGSCTCKGGEFGIACSHIEAAKLTVAAQTGGEVA